MEPWVIILLGLAAYILLVLYIGYRGYKVTKRTLEDYYLAGRGLGVLILMFTIFATYQSAYMYIGVTGFTYEHGVGIWYSNAANLLWAFLFIFIGIPLWRLGKAFGYITQADFFAHRFNSNILRLIIALWMVLGLLPYIGSQALATGRTLTTISSGVIALGVAVMLYAITIIIYTSLGGMRSVAWTDLIQGLLMLGLIFVALEVLLGKVGGIPALFEKVYAIKPELLSIPGPKGLMTPEAWLGYLLCDALGGIMWIQNWVRFYAGKSWKTLALMTFLVPIGTTLMFFFSMLVGLCGVVLEPGLPTGDLVFPTLMVKHLPLWATAGVIIGLFAASMSTVDSISLALSSSISKDIITLAKPELDESSLVNLGRLFVVAVIIAGCIVGYYAAGTYLVVLLTLLSLSLSAVLFPIAVAALYWKRANKYGAIAGIIVGIIIGVKTLLFGPEFAFDIYGGLWAIIGCALTLIIVSLITPVSDKEAKSVEQISRALSSPIATMVDINDAYKVETTMKQKYGAIISRFIPNA